MAEAHILINGQKLSEGQAMALRVACTSFREQMAGTHDALGDDPHGRRMAAAYADRLLEVLTLMIGP